MTMQYKAGLGNVGSYQASATPFLSGSIAVAGSGSTPTQISFPRVSRFVTIKNDGTDVFRVGFSANGIVSTNYFVLARNESYTGEWRVVSVHLLSEVAGAGTASVIAGLTPIDAQELPDNWSGSVGVG